MRQFSLFTVSLASLFLLLIPHETPSPVTALYPNLINSTCKQCAEKSTTFNYDFCTSSLQTIPISHAINLQGLALIAMELALENATNTISYIEKMISTGKFDPYTLGCLKDCSELYLDGVSMLVNSIQVFWWEQYNAANLLLNTVMETAATCEEGFKEKAGEVSPLTVENYDLSQLGAIALCITDLLSLALDSDSS